MQAVSSRPLLAGLALGALCGVLCGVGLGILDGAQAGLRASQGSLAAIPLAVCLYAPVGLMLGLLLGAVAGGVRALLPPGYRGIRRALHDRPALDQAMAAGLIAGALCLLLEVLLVHRFGMTAGAAMSNRRLASLATFQQPGVVQV